jgi:hypothetical protein
MEQNHIVAGPEFGQLEGHYLNVFLMVSMGNQPR